MNNISEQLIEKYNRSIPRYTSYPTILDWKLTHLDQQLWLNNLNTQLDGNHGLSLYIHLPYCESLCTYCGCNKRITKNHGVESSYIDAILQEWEIYVANLTQPIVIKEIHLGGGTPTFFSPAELNRMLTNIFSKATKHQNFQASFEAHPNSTTAEHLQTLYDHGFSRISVGVQDVSNDILKAINRKQSLQEVEYVTQTAREIGYTSVNYDIIYGLPFQTEINIEKTIHCIEKQRPDRIAFYSYAHVPWKSASQRAFTIDNVPYGQAKYKLYNQGRERLQALGYLPVGMDHFCLETDSLYDAYANGKMHRNFMGYTAQHTQCMIGLGASSISDSFNMFVQNEKTIEAYKEAVSEGRLPLIKGHLLSNDQQRIRKHFLQLMCQNQTTFSDHLVDNTLRDLFHLNGEELIADGLINMNEGSITVTEIGQYFIRNICASIDPMLQYNQPIENKYSKAV